MNTISHPTRVFELPILGDDFVDFLRQVISEPQVELEWIDLLSQLEYVGCRKILRTIGFEDVSVEILRHVQEESLHAYLLKSVVEQASPGRPWSESRFAECGWTYFRELDEEISRLSSDTRLAYPGVSWAVERRVLAVYPLYVEMTQNRLLQRSLRQILAQERRHGGLFHATKFPDRYRQQLTEIEDRLWTKFKATALRLITQ